MRLLPWRVRSSHPAGFSLVEILVVLAVVAILAVILVPTIGGTGDARRLTAATAKLTDEMALAQAQATAINGTVELRLYLGSGDTLAGHQLVELSSDGTTLRQLTPVKVLPEPLAAMTSGAFSTLLTQTELSDLATRGDAWKTPSPDFAVVRFLANGSVDLDASKSWTLTLAPRQYATATSLPANFATILLRPTTARAQVVRPD